MPIVDGLASTRLVRSYEKTHPANHLSDRATLNGRIPVFAVSASLVEKERQVYIDGGFDGWILKPIDFRRLNILLSGIVEMNIRVDCLYKPGNWEKGGWFSQEQPNVFTAAPMPSIKAPVLSTGPASGPVEPLGDRTDTERDRLNTLETDAVHSSSEPQELDQSGKLSQCVVEDYTHLP